MLKIGYKKLAFETHPDHNDGKDEKFKAMKEMHDALSVTIDARPDNE